jgi:predicted metal-dependent hydrolase
MQKQIVLGNQKVIYTFKKSRRARRVRLSVYPGGAVVVTIPYFLRENVVERFMRMHASWLLQKIAHLAHFPVPLTPQHTNILENVGMFRKHKETVRALVHARVRYYSEFYQIPFGRIFIKNQKTRWGSASSKGNLSFNYRIALLPEHLRDYIIVHELCHLAEFNHSRKFWSLVAKAVPNHKAMRRELRKWGMGLA